LGCGGFTHANAAGEAESDHNKLAQTRNATSI
jgi:hypothetical protein